jgi:hypothetical protein
MEPYLTAVADLWRLLQQIVTDLPQLYVLEADFVRGVAGGGEDTMVNYGGVVTSFTDTSLSRSCKTEWPHQYN